MIKVYIAVYILISFYTACFWFLILRFSLPAGSKLTVGAKLFIALSILIPPVILLVGLIRIGLYIFKWLNK